MSISTSAVSWNKNSRTFVASMFSDLTLVLTGLVEKLLIPLWIDLRDILSTRQRRLGTPNTLGVGQTKSFLGLYPARVQGCIILREVEDIQVEAIRLVLGILYLISEHNGLSDDALIHQQILSLTIYLV
jgi:hypothetical protein